MLIGSGRPCTLAFNHRNARTALWDDEVLKLAHGYRTLYPDLPAVRAPHGGLSLDLLGARDAG